MTRGYSDLYEEVSRLHGLGEGEVDLLAEAGGALPLHHHLGGTLQAAAGKVTINLKLSGMSGVFYLAS